jgi:type II secretory pathway component PulF
MTTLYRYTAVDPKLTRRNGEISGSDEAEVRRALRRLGLQVVEIEPLGKPKWDRELGESTSRTPAWATRFETSGPFLTELRGMLASYLRRRRIASRAEWADSLSTMLRSGMPLLEAIETMLRSSTSATRRRRMLLEMRESLRGGSSLAAAMRMHESWFDPVEVAMVEAGQHGGTLHEVLERLADRHERRHSLSQRLASALAYPMIVAAVGVGVAIFLSLYTLPQLDKILVDAKLQSPLLTRLVMTAGQAVARHGVWVVPAVCLVGLTIVVVSRMHRDRGDRRHSFIRAFSPKIVRQMAIGDFSLQLAELVRVGVPVVEALRVLAPTAGGSLRASLQNAALRLERGEELTQVLDDARYFNEEFRRLVELGSMSGELPLLLERLGERQIRQCRRYIDRLASFAEPAVILILAFMVGIVVMAAVLPLVKLREAF